MTHYFIKEGKNEEGPFTLEELKEQSIEKHTQVWFAGLKEWTSVEHVYELKQLFHKKPIPEPETSNAFVNFLRKVFFKKNEHPEFRMIPRA